MTVHRSRPAPSDAARDRFTCQRADLTAWKSRDAAACIALSSLLPESEEAHFTQVRTAIEFLTAIKARYATPTTVSLGRLFLPFLFPDLASFECSADLIAHLRSLDSSYPAACTDAQLALLPPPMVITIYFIATSLPDRLASVHDTLLLKHPSELTIEVLESALKDIESNLCSVASASGAVPPPLFHGCTVPQLPTFTASLATATTDVTKAAVTTSSRSRGRGGRRGGQGAGGGGGDVPTGGGVSGGGGGGDAPTGGGGSAGPGEASRAAASDSPTAVGGGDTCTRQPPPGLPAAVAVSGQVPMSGPVVASCSCRSLAHPTVLWHHRMGHPSLPRLNAMSRQSLVLGLLHVLPSLPPSLAPPCGPCIEGRLRANPHSSSLRPATKPFETLHLDVWGPAPRFGPERERFFLVVVDDYSRYTIVFPLAKKSEVTSTYAAHQLNLWPRVSRPEASPTSLWTGSPGVASRFRVWGCLALVRDTSADKLSPRAVPCVFLGFLEDSSDFTFYHPPSHLFFDSRDVRFEESTPYYVRYPCRAPSGVSQATPPPLVAPQVQPPSPKSSS
ncbi:unnamed protein product [Closterium sp. NIES-65]|nr:unnamed protein product [Closterium sp. NIES-65]